MTRAGWLALALLAPVAAALALTAADEPDPNADADFAEHCRQRGCL